MGNPLLAPPQLTAWPLIAPIQVAPTPVPTQVAVGEMRMGAEKMIVLQLATNSGVQTYFLDDGAAAQVGRRLLELASGLVMPPKISGAG